MSRPAWVFKMGDAGRRNARHEFMSQRIMARPLGDSQADAFASASTAWKIERGDAVQARKLKRRAIAQNVLARARKDAHLDKVNASGDYLKSPWDVGRGSMFPLHARDIADQTGTRHGVIDLSSIFRRGSYSSPPDEDCPQTVNYIKPLSFEMAEMTMDERDALNKIVNQLGIIYVSKGYSADYSSPLLAFDADGNNVVI
jgi:hypothetical protein